MDSVVDNLTKHLEKEIKTNPLISIKEVFQNFALDTIGVCAFGINTNSFEKDDNQILKWGKDMFSVIICRTWIESAFALVMSHLSFLTKYTDLYPESFDKLFATTKQIIEERREKNIEKEDFIGKLSKLIQNPEPPLTPDLITAQGVIFFAAGFETTSSTLSTFSYNLAKHPEIQVPFCRTIMNYWNDFVL